MIADPSQRVQKLPEEPVVEFTVDPCAPFSDKNHPQNICRDSSACQCEDSDLVDPLIAFTPNLRSRIEPRPDVRGIPVGAGSNTPWPPSDELDAYEIAVATAPSETASQDAGSDNITNTTAKPETHDLDELVLMNGEHTESSLNLNRDGAKSRNILILTNRRLIQIGQVSRQRSVSFVAISGVDSVIIEAERRGYRGYIWGVLSLFIAAILWTNWNQPIGSVIVPIMVILMGIYLVIDHILSVRNLVVSFKVGSSVINAKLDEHIPSEKLTTFVNRIFELKETSNVYSK